MSNHPERLKLYLLVRDDVPLGFQCNSLAHAAVGGVVTWLQEEQAWQNINFGVLHTKKTLDKNSIVTDWLERSFKKVCVVATLEQFEKAKSMPDAMVFSESDLDNKEIAIALKPRYNWPSWLRELPLIGEEG